ncbi:IPT/TIG domain-containing protein [Pricia sp. S334]|uniref:IPT/TIG domain-containing protein n=1 Tax=Pricia mediterranea TaxID=3076079 RepID=A0ABU3L071_9FLAO|nr:right-handed parallel beta-helix repeat-containing protein [Pricia sp. S334]MDT7827129.1 IPT/TIG domain-containing protein [Pricia sp. S334]
MKTVFKIERRSICRLLMIITVAGFMASSCSNDGGDGPMVDDDPVDLVPTITAISPSSGPVGTEVKITGTNFSSTGSDNEVTFNGAAATVNSGSTTQLVVDVPENATSGTVSVTVLGETVRGPSFTVITSDTSLCDQNEILENTVWEDKLPGDEIDYVVQCAISVKGNALLTIASGVIIAFEGDDSGIFTSEGGALKAVGTQNEPIKFLGTSGKNGVWKGIYFGSNHPENRLEHVTVMHAGRSASSQTGEKGAVQLSRDENSRATIVNCTITDNDGYGLFLTDESVLEGFSGNTISDNENAPVAIFFNQLGALDASTVYQGTAKNYIEVRENEIEDDIVNMPLLNIPYRFVESKKYSIKNTLNIAAGNTLEFTGGAGLRLGEQASDCADTSGALNATGTMDSPITFKGVTAGKGSWLGIGFNSSSPNNKLVYCNISDGGSSGIYNASDFAANITLQCESRVTIQNSTISNSAGFGIYMLDNDAELEGFELNEIVNNELAPLWMHLPQVDQLDSETSYAEGNGRPYIQIEGNAVTEADLTIKKLEVPYRIETEKSGRETYVERAITIEAGTILEFETGAGMVLGSPGVDCIPTTGSMNAQGTAEEPIVFRGAAEGQGTWLGIGINSSSSANQLSYCEISGGGSKQMYNAGGQGNIVIHCSGNLNIENCTIEDSGGWGIDFVQGGNSLSETETTFSNNALGNIASD